MTKTVLIYPAHMGFWSSDARQEPFFLWISREADRKPEYGVILDSFGLALMDN